MSVKNLHNKMLKIDARVYIVTVFIILFLSGVLIMNKTSTNNFPTKWSDVSFPRIMGFLFGVIGIYINILCLFTLPIAVLNKVFKKLQDHTRIIVILGIYLIAYSVLMYVLDERQLIIPILDGFISTIQVALLTYTYLLFDQRRDIKSTPVVFIILFGFKILELLQIFLVS